MLLTINNFFEPSLYVVIVSGRVCSILMIIFVSNSSTVTMQMCAFCLQVYMCSEPQYLYSNLPPPR